ncbi:trigger factor [Quercus suber]|uniref:peptidylprolyl isomerase n=1 Tax=Quercus suber TaxID=58331 RepID=A0AAW0JWL0_QUESU
MVVGVVLHVRVVFNQGLCCFGNVGLEASVTDQKGKTIKLKSAKIVIESQDENKMQIQVDLTGDETEKVFDQVLTNLARTAPPVPGFRRQKGGKILITLANVVQFHKWQTYNFPQVPKSFLLQMLGEERVTKFVIQEIVNSTMDDYVKNENLNVKDNKINTIQKVEELMSSFTPGKEFRFNAILELEGSEIKTSS